MATKSHTDPFARAAALALRSRAGGKTAKEVSEALGIPLRTVDEILRRAKSHGFDPTAQTLHIRPEYVQDAPRSGRPRKQTTPVTTEATPEKES
ncbi:hypothetical protein CCHL11_09628 [Colletotrichum chlorophyti]|uniref:Uncharacterized protein n=1 Tax=Colletotrichum chlorophyti TaxID=708187 RepID=A0A1Q8S8D7_9PEZI|nr:hypothetical protein CCHL11_09628 [Colletotrichum chlorophyti]